MFCTVLARNGSADIRAIALPAIINEELSCR
jgi:hypothetical protein